MTSARGRHACSVIPGGLVLVAGGGRGDARTKTEYFDTASLTWTPGSDLPTSLWGAKLFSADSDTFLLAGTNNKKISKLGPMKKLTAENLWKWTEVGEMKDTRSSFTTFLISVSTYLFGVKKKE